MKKWVVFIIGAICVGIGGLFSLKEIIPSRIDFYPTAPSEGLLSKPRQFFQNQQYLDVTSYVDQKLMQGNYTPKQRQELLFWEAESYFQLGQYELAKRNFLNLFNQNSNFWQSSLRLAIIHVLENPKEELETLTKNIPPNDELYYWTGYFYENKKFYSKALSYYRKVGGNNPLANFHIGNILFTEKFYEECIPFLEKSLSDTRADHFMTIKTIFEAYVATGDHQNALKYSNALKMYLSNNPSLVQEVALRLIHLGELEQARNIYTVLDSQLQLTSEFAIILANLSYKLKDYKKVIRYSSYIPLNDEPYLHLLDSYFQLGQMRTLLLVSGKHFTTKKEETRFSILDYRAKAYQELGLIREAIKAREKMDEMIPSSAQNTWALGELYYKVHNKKGLELLSDRLLQNNPQRFSEIMNNLFSFSLFSKAQELLDKILIETPLKEEALFFQAKIYESQKHDDSFKNTLIKLMELSPKDKSIAYYTYYSLGSLNIKEKSYTDALFLLQEAKRISPSNTISIKIAITFLLEGETENALKEINMIKDSPSLTLEEKKIIDKILYAT